MKNIIVSAPGKLMLLGEHAVVYNNPCLVTAVDQRMRLTIETLNVPEFHLNAPDVHVVNYTKNITEIGKGNIPKGAKFVEIAVKNIFNVIARSTTIVGDEAISLNNGLPASARPWQAGVATLPSLSGVARNDKSIGLRITTKSEFSPRYGFGSSSASVVCTIKALSELFKLDLTSKEIFDLSYQTILDAQGAGSGFDVAAAIYGGTIYFTTGGKTIEPLAIRHLPLVVGYSGVKADTVTLVNEVREKANKYPKIIEKIHSSIGELVELAKIKLLEKDLRSFGQLMDINQGFLDSLGVSNNKLAGMIYASRTAGAYGAKLSGAGGGDCIIALAPEKNRIAVERAIIKAGGEIINVQANAQGVKIE